MIGSRKDGSKVEVSRAQSSPTREMFRHLGVEEGRAAFMRLAQAGGMPAKVIAEVFRCSPRTARRDRSAVPDIMQSFAPRD